MGYTKERAKYKAEGVVLHALKYGERRMIVNMLTRDHGRCGYIVTVGSGAKSVSRAMLQPLTCLEYEGELPGVRDGLHKMSDVRMVRFSDLGVGGGYSPARSMLVMFISELLYRVVQDCDEGLYEFVRGSLEQLEGLSGMALANFHLYFMVALARELGYSPHNNYSVGDYFDISQGSFVGERPKTGSYFEPVRARLLSELLMTQLEDLGNLEMGRDQRRAFLYSMVDYYGYHTNTIHSVRSVEVLADLA